LSPVLPSLGVVIVTYNSGEDVLNALESLQDAAQHTPLKVVVVDNHSTDLMPTVIAARFPEVDVIQLSANRGFANAANVGFRALDSSYVVLLNPDAIPEPGSFDTMLEFAQRTPTAGVVAPSLRYPDGRNQGTARSFPTSSAGLFGRRSLLTRLFPKNRWSTRFLSGRDREGEPFTCDWVSGACMLFPQEVLLEAGGFDERYFLFWEDAAWCHRLHQSGYEVWTIPDAVVVHREGGSRKGWPPPVVRHFHRGAYLYWKTYAAPQWWNPLRWGAAAALGGRAAVLVVGHQLSHQSNVRIEASR
jgi:N-acetylglucosaminyl-diphospho-decaprenol L-rhamnosyltransferase